MTMGKKLNLTDLKVRSFVTELNKKKESKIKGGVAQSYHIKLCQQPHTITGELACCLPYLSIDDTTCC